MIYILVGLIVFSLLIIFTYVYYRRKKKNAFISAESSKVESAMNNESNPNNDSSTELWNVRDVSHQENELWDKPGSQISISHELREKVPELLKSSNNFKRTIGEGQGATYVLNFSEKTNKAIKEGRLSLMQAKDNARGLRAQAVDARGKTVEHGVLTPKNFPKVNPTQLAMGILTTATAQEHLQRINNELKTINNKVDKLNASIDHRQVGNDKGNIDYLKTIFEGLDQGKYTEEDVRDYRQQIESIIRATMQDLSTLEEGFPGIQQKMEKEKYRGIVTAEKEVQNIKAMIEEFDKQSEIYYSKLEVITVCLSLGKYLNSNYLADQSRLDYVESKLTNLDAEQNKFFGRVESRVPELGARIRINREKYNNRVRNRIADQVESVRSQYDSSRSHLNNRLKRTKSEGFFDSTFGDSGKASYAIKLDDDGELTTMKKLFIDE